jgi:hypothetical protein
VIDGLKWAGWALAATAITLCAVAATSLAAALSSIMALGIDSVGTAVWVLVVVSLQLAAAIALWIGACRAIRRAWATWPRVPLDR